ncbi:hypothetical protein [Paenarthrobacter sp. YJN-5]|uniref:hypothetical protein n=1 Tax=Paenarthrobacter sp. YJN-5 TaxID=2735316 RepID=UPI00187800BE|nr:hypothetical protein [Paenarthrobacter sp. YJN-5]QOT16511.1 hypothetical protein HMI59_07765 [Paenarthrobacter sp. YJN-5]
MKQRHALAALIDDVRSANGWSDPDVVARAASKGHKLSKSNISRIRNNPVVTLNIETVSALADGLGVSKAMVAQAALASMGIVTYNSADLTTEEAIRRDPTLGEREKQMLLVVLGGLRESPEPNERAVRNELLHGRNGPIDFSKASERRNARAGQKMIPDVSGDPSDGNIPLPDNWQELAAYTGPTSHEDREREWSERGEESQDRDDAE